LYRERIAQCLTPEVARRIVDFRPDARTEERLEYLREKANEGVLSNAERLEYEGFVDALDFVGVLKARARSLLVR